MKARPRNSIDKVQKQEQNIKNYLCNNSGFRTTIYLELDWLVKIIFSYNIWIQDGLNI